MTIFRDRTGDFTKKKYLYKFYKNGFTSRRPKYMTAGQYMGSTSEFLPDTNIPDNADIGGGVSDGSYLSVFGTSFNSNESLIGGLRVWTDKERMFDIEGIKAIFKHNGGAYQNAVFYNYKITLFDYSFLYDEDTNTFKLFYKEIEMKSVSMTEDYRWIKFYEEQGFVFVDISPDGETWNNWESREIDPEDDIIKTSLMLEASGGTFGVGGFSASVGEIEITDRNNNLLAIEANTINDLEFTESINNPASTTTITFPYSPKDVPKHIDFGNYVEISANFYDDGNISNENIQDHNEEDIEDENSLPIKGVVLKGNVPEKYNIPKFSGYVSAIEYDYDTDTITVRFISHGETLANSVVRGNQIAVSVINQSQRNSSVAVANSRQTFRLQKTTKINRIKAFMAMSGGGSTWLTIGRTTESGSSVTIATSDTRSWAGSLNSELLFEFSGLVLSAGDYWIRAGGSFSGLTWQYQNTDVLENGSRQTLSGGQWSNVAGDVYFGIESYQPELALALSGSSTNIANEIFEKSLELDNSPVYIESVEDAGYDININLSIDTAKNAINSLYRQLPTGWFYSINTGTNALRMKNRNSAPDHLLVLGRDFVNFTLSKDIDEIVNEVYFIGAPIIENGPKLSTITSDEESIGKYRKGLSINSNEKVSRYDTAGLLSEHEIGNNNAPRLTSVITISASKYNTETVEIGHVVKIANADGDVLNATMVVADIKYAPEQIVVSLDSAPRNLSRTIDSIQRDLENSSTANSGNVI